MREMAEMARNAFAALDQGDAERALDLARRVIEAEANHPQALHAAGIAAHRLGRLDEARQWLLRARAVQPQDAALLNNLAAVLRGLGDRAGALEALGQALRIAPRHPILNCFLGELLLEAGDAMQALACLDVALASHPSFAEATFHRGNALSLLGRVKDAASAFGRAAALAPHLAAAHYNLANELCRMGRVAESLPGYRQAIALDPANATARSNLITALQYVAGEAEIDAECAAFAAALEAPLRAQWPRHRPVRDGQRRLRIGYVSADLRTHSVAYFMLPLMETRDRARFDVVCYYNNTVGDALQARFASLADHWVPCAGLDDAQLAARVMDDAIDILVDLGGHTAANRLGVFALKPAPVQVSYLGYPGSTGLAAIAARISDATADPPRGEGAPDADRVVRLADCFLCYRPPQDAPNVRPLPAIASGRITFCSFNMLQKVTPGVVALWARILQAVPSARLMIKSQGLEISDIREALQAQFAARGIGPDRLLLLGRDAATASHLDRYAEADIALDPFPYNGTTTTCEALWMGVPVVTLRGHRHASRVGTSLLEAAGLGAWVAGSEEEYVEIAARWAANVPRLGELRENLRTQVSRSPLHNQLQFTRRFEEALLQLWEQACDAASSR
ncbi:MAG: tetratricopeptide repeat protein [Betaproteobacteria bacterium]|nr:tetratricopeptide repeat protein [Betaproteobacteria bacterium]